MKRLNSYVAFQILIILATYVGCWFEKKELFKLIEHNRLINSIIILLFFGSSLYVFIDAISSACKGHLWRKHKDNLSENDSLKIFGHKFHKITDTSNDNQNEIVSLWKTSIEWKGNVLDYISGTLIGVGLLGTFIGLMHTMGSVFNVLSTSVSGKDLVSELGVPLSGMSTAFSASMLGLSTSLTVGLLSVLTAKVNNEFISEVENWSLEIKNSKEGYNNTSQGSQYLRKVLLRVEENNNLVKINNDYFSEFINHIGNDQACLADLNMTMLSVSDNTSRTNDIFNDMKSLLSESNTKTEIVRTHLEAIIKNSIQDSNDNKKAWRDIEQGIMSIKSLVENSENNINKFQKIQEIMYESGFFCVNEIVSMRRLLETNFTKEHNKFIGRDHD